MLLKVFFSGFLAMETTLVADRADSRDLAGSIGFEDLKAPLEDKLVVCRLTRFDMVAVRAVCS